MGNKWYNQDGLTVRYGTRPAGEDDYQASQPSTAGRTQEISFLLDLVNDCPTDATAVAAGEFANSARLPSDAVVQKVTIVTKVAAASGGAADLLLGTYDLDAAGQLALGDADSLCAAGDSALADFSVAGESIVLGKAAAAALIGKAEVGSDAYVAASSGIAYTAGELQVTIEYTR